TALNAVGRVENGIRRVRVLHSITDFAQDNRLMAMRVTDGDFGKSEIIAILSRDDLFETRRPRDESVASFAEALAEIQQERPGNIIGMATRILDARP
ncbi:MAG TPA: serine/threonine protein kinase, partial [Paracoccaceae bacterium]